jgi:hypothetical protein
VQYGKYKVHAPTCTERYKINIIIQDAEAFRAPTSIPSSRVQRMPTRSRVFMQAASPLAQLGDKVTTLLVSSPLYPIMVKKARETMKKTAEGAGIDWEGEVAKVRDIDNLEGTFPATSSFCFLHTFHLRPQLTR